MHLLYLDGNYVRIYISLEYTIKIILNPESTKIFNILREVTIKYIFLILCMLNSFELLRVLQKVEL